MTETRKFKASIAERVFAGAGVAALGAASAAVWYFDPTKASFFPMCPLFAATGFACPGCGLTRGFHALFHGDVLTALDFNAMLPLFAALVGFFVISLLLIAIRGRGLRVDLLTPKLLWGSFSLLIVFALVRNIPVYPLTILYP